MSDFRWGLSVVERRSYSIAAGSRSLKPGPIGLERLGADEASAIIDGSTVVVACEMLTSNHDEQRRCI